MEGNLEIKKEIIELLSQYISKHPTQRFGQVLFNLNVNQFKTNENQNDFVDYELRDIYNDEDFEILDRLKQRLEIFNKNNI